MANTYYSTQEKTGVQAVYGTGAFMATFSFSLAGTVGGAGFGLNDVVNLAQIPANSALVDFFIDLPQLDSNGTPTVTIDIGDGGSANRYIAAGQFGRSTTATVLGPQSASVTANGGWQQGTLPHTYSAKDNLMLKIHAAPATATTSGTISGYVVFWGGQNQ